MQRNKVKFWNSIYFRLICRGVSIILSINLIAILLFKTVELRDAEELLKQQLIKQAESIIELRKLAGDKFTAFIEVMYGELYHVAIFSEDFTNSQAENYMDKMVYQQDISGNSLTIIKTENPMNLQAILLVDNYCLHIIPAFDNGIMKRLEDRILQFIEGSLISNTLVITCMLLYIGRKIKVVTNAVKVISNGTFDVELSEKGNDEIAELIRAVNYMVKELKKNEYLHKEFASSVSHEFKTPITSLKGYAMLSKNKDIPEEVRQEYLDIIINESNRLSKLSSNLLRISELNHQVSTKYLKWFSMDEQIRDIIIVLQPQWEEKQIDFDVELEEINFYGDKGVLWHLWNNLIVNAILYSENGGVIRVLLKGKLNGIVFSVEDKGIGMCEEDREKIFEQFYTVNKSRSHKGNGLGLTIVKRIVEMYNGRIWVASALGAGSCFYVELDNVCEKKKDKCTECSGKG